MPASSTHTLLLLRPQSRTFAATRASASPQSSEARTSFQPKWSLAGQVCVVTGGTSGLGAAAAARLAASGASVILGARDVDKGRALAADITPPGAPPMRVERLDLSCRESIREFVSTLHETVESVAVLLHAAGVMGWRTRGSDGDNDRSKGRGVARPFPFNKSTFPYEFGPNAFEELLGYDPMMVVNHLGPFLLTNLLMETDLFVNSRVGTRIVTVSSNAHFNANLDFECERMIYRQKWINNALHPLKGYFSRSWYTLYANSKLANLLFSMELNRRLTHNEIMVGETSPVCSPSNMIAVAVSPGRTKTALFKSLPNDIEGYVARIASQFFQSPEKGAETLIYACQAPAADFCQHGPVWTPYLHDCKEAAVSTDITPELAESLWNYSVNMTGLRSRVPLASGVVEEGRMQKNANGYFWKPKTQAIEDAEKNDKLNILKKFN